MAFPDGWGRKQKITIDNTKVAGSGSHSDFPVLITLDHLDAEIVDAGSNSALNGGGDVRFSSDAAGSSRLALDIVSFVTNATEGNRECEMWTNPTISTSANTDIYIWYKKAAETQPAVSAAFGRNSVWSDADYINVYHMNESPAGTIVDSTGVNDGTQSGGMVAGDQVAAQIGDGFTFDDTGKTFSVSTSIGTKGTTSIWVKPNFGLDPSDTYQAVSTAVGGATHDLGMKTFSEENWHAVHRGSFGATVTLRDAPLSSLPSQFYYLVTNWDSDADEYNLYVDGALEINSTATTGNISIGSLKFGTGWKGILDEGRCSSAIRSAGWITTEYNNQFAPATFASAGTPEEVGGVTTRRYSLSLTGVG